VTAKTDFKSVDEYIASQPEAVRGILGRVRSTIRKAVPRAHEVISYKSDDHATNDLEHIVQRIRKGNLAAAQRVARTIYSEWPNSAAFRTVGASVSHRTPENSCFAVAVHVLRIRHASQDWLEKHTCTRGLG
jgi:plasmid stabilization system protein ParE